MVQGVYPPPPLSGPTTKKNNYGTYMNTLTPKHFLCAKETATIFCS